MQRASLVRSQFGQLLRGLEVEFDIVDWDRLVLLHSLIDWLRNDLRVDRDLKLLSGLSIVFGPQLFSHFLSKDLIDLWVSLRRGATTWVHLLIRVAFSRCELLVWVANRTIHRTLSRVFSVFV